MKKGNQATGRLWKTGQLTSPTAVCLEGRVSSSVDPKETLAVSLPRLQAQKSFYPWEGSLEPSWKFRPNYTSRDRCPPPAHCPLHHLFCTPHAHTALSPRAPELLSWCVCLHAHSPHLQHSGHTPTHCTSVPATARTGCTTTSICANPTPHTLYLTPTLLPVAYGQPPVTPALRDTHTMPTHAAGLPSARPDSENQPQVGMVSRLTRSGRAVTGVHEVTWFRLFPPRGECRSLRSLTCAWEQTLCSAGPPTQPAAHGTRTHHQAQRGPVF